jgi:D-alanine transaminase
MELYLNGEYLPIEQGRVSVEDRGFQFGDGVYEVLRAYGGRLFRAREHLARLERSLKFLEAPLPEPLPKIEEVCRRVIGGPHDALVYLQVTRGAAPRVHAFPKGIRPTFLAYARPFKADPPGKTWTLLSMLDDRWAHCDVKTVCLLANVLGRERAARAGCDEGLFVREDGTVTEGNATNAFLVRGGAILTHPADHRVLHGITREAALQAAREQRIPVLEQPFTLAEALGGDEFFMTGTGCEAMPVVAIDGKKIGSGSPGPVTLRLQSALAALVRRELA